MMRSALLDVTEMPLHNSDDSAYLGEVARICERLGHRSDTAFKLLFPLGMATVLMIGWTRYQRNTDRYARLVRRAERLADRAIDAAKSRHADAVAEEYEPFNPDLQDIDSSGRPYRYVRSPYDETYLAVPGPAGPAGMLPPEDLEVRSLILQMNIVRRRAAQDGRSPAGALNVLNGELRGLLARSHSHRCALRRIAAAMPEQSSERAGLLSFFE